MALWIEVARRGFRRHATYRAATVAGIFTNTVFGVIQAHVLVAIFREQATIGGFDVTDAVTFTFVAQGLLMVVAVFTWDDIALRVRTGDVVSDLYRPVDFQWYWLAQDYGRAAFQAVFRGVPPLVAGALLFTLRLSGDPVDWLAFIASLGLAVAISFGIRFAVNLTAFWLLDIRGPNQVVTMTWLFLSGFILPITFFPGWLATAARATPFASVVQLPIELLLGKHEGAAVAGVLATQAAWTVAMLGAGRLLLRAAVRKVVIQGG